MTIKKFAIEGSIEALLVELKPRLRRWEASAYLVAKYVRAAAAPATLAKRASVVDGLKFQMLNACPLYPINELDTWAAERLGPLASSTSVESDTERTGSK